MGVGVEAFGFVAGFLLVFGCESGGGNMADHLERTKYLLTSAPRKRLVVRPVVPLIKLVWGLGFHTPKPTKFDSPSRETAPDQPSIRPR